MTKRVPPKTRNNEPIIAGGDTGEGQKISRTAPQSTGTGTRVFVLDDDVVKG